jgi:uncharacterized phage-associated protein
MMVAVGAEGVAEPREKSCRMARTPFDERKATQVAARFLAAAPGQRLPYLKLVKLMYFADREALLRWGAPITNDRYFSLDHGPILSRVKDLMVEEHSERDYWSTHISAPTSYVLELLDETGGDRLSRAEERLIDEIYAEYRYFDRWELRAKSHELPEWTDPHGSAIEIEIEDILRAGGIPEPQRDVILRELNGYRKMQALSSD